MQGPLAQRSSPAGFVWRSKCCSGRARIMTNTSNLKDHVVMTRETFRRGQRRFFDRVPRW